MQTAELVRSRYPDLDIPEPRPHPLCVEGPSDAEADVCIVGSGAGGAILGALTWRATERGR